jgi:1,4-alpha-glucan branching enzyme
MSETSAAAPLTDPAAAAAHYAEWAGKTDGTACVRDDAGLAAHAGALRYRTAKFREVKAAIEAAEGGVLHFARGYERFGLHRVAGGVRYTEWAPGAAGVSLFGEFNGWVRGEFCCVKDAFGVWEVTIPNKADGTCAIPHRSRVKACVVSGGGMQLDRNPAWASYCVQNKDTFLFDTAFWNPPPAESFAWEHPHHVPRPDCLRIYECHVGMGSNDPKVGTYREFADVVLPRIARAGYTAIQIMAIMEHAYYASFGYHVTNFFAVSSRSGTPDDLKYLIDIAHGLGLHVLMDVVHSHASSNSMDGINQFDGTDNCYFHEGERGNHKLWDSRLFNYGHWEVLRFLLSNLRWYVEEYHFDGFRFDGITSMLYTHHGISYDFTGDYKEYFNHAVDTDAIVYMMLANELVHSLIPDSAITIAEDVSGMPTLCVPVERGGIGFDYRLAMAVPDKWIELLEKQKDENWDMGNIVHTLTNRRWNEKTIGYAESHDQALVGDKTMAFWLMDAAMYDQMSVHGPLSGVVDRGVALHKMIRMLCYALAGEGYLTFMGNEFGHPEWVDFPRAGNNNSYHHARRRWDLADNPELRYKFLLEWERQMHECESAFPFCRFGAHQYVVLQHEADKVIAIERGDRNLMVFNLHTSNSYTDYRIGTFWSGKYRLVLDSDAMSVGGHSRVSHDVVHVSRPEPWQNRPNFVQLYSPARSCQVYHCYETVEEPEEKAAGAKAAPAAKAPEERASAGHETCADTTSPADVPGTKAVETVSAKLAKSDLLPASETAQ